MSSDPFVQLLENSLSRVVACRSGVVKGKVIAMSGDFATVDLGLKSEAFVPLAEFKNEEGDLEIEVGQEVELAAQDSEHIDPLDNGLGEVSFSYEKAKRVAAWADLEGAFQNESIVVGMIVDRVKGGFTVLLNGLRAFLPGSLADIRPVRDPAYLENKPLEFRVVKMDRKRNNIVVSRRAVIEAETSEERTQLLESLQEGQVIKGIVKNLTDYGAFIDLGGIDGLLHITDMSWKRVKHPSEIINVGDEIDVKVLSFDKEKSRVSLGFKQLQNDPWVDVSSRHPIGTRLFGRVSNITDYGCFVEVEEGIEGLVHMSEMDWTDKNIHPNKVVKLDQEVEVMVLDIDDKRRRISLGVKQCLPNPWVEFAQNYREGTRIVGPVNSITDFGLFIGLDGGIDGLVHSTDISWSLSGEEAIRQYQKGDEVEAIVISIDPDRERISLGMKQLADDPVQAYLDLHARGSEVTGTVTQKDSKRVVVALAENVEGSLRASEVEDGVEVGSELTVFVSSSERKGSMVLLSTTKPVEEKPVNRQIPQSLKDAGPGATTFGDLMKEQMNKD